MVRLRGMKKKQSLRHKTLLDFCKKPRLEKESEMPTEPQITITETGALNNQQIVKANMEETKIELDMDRKKQIVGEMQLELSRVTSNQRKSVVTPQPISQGGTKEGGTQTCEGISIIPNADDKSTQAIALHGCCSKIEIEWSRNCENLPNQAGIGLTEDILSDHEAKLSLLGDYTLRVIGKVRELASTWDEMDNYGVNILEPWRNGVSNTLKFILEGAEILEKTVGNLYEGCNNLEDRIIRLENDLSSLAKENISVRGEMEELRGRTKQIEDKK